MLTSLGLLILLPFIVHGLVLCLKAHPGYFVAGLFLFLLPIVVSVVNCLTDKNILINH